MKQERIRRKPNQKPQGTQNKVALQRIAELFNEANSVFKERPDLSKRYVWLARKIAMRQKVKFTKAQKMQYCKQCGAYLFPGLTSKIRASHGKIIVHCNECKAKQAFAYKP